MEVTFNHTDFGMPDEPTFERALTCGPWLRFMIRMAKGDLAKAKKRLELGQNVLQTEREAAMGETSMVRFISDRVSDLENAIEYHEKRVSFLRGTLSEGY
jgi:hypothetical protein